MEEQNITPKRSPTARRAAKKKKLRDIYMTLGIGVFTWVLIIFALVFSIRSVVNIINGNNTPLEPDVDSTTTAPIVPLDNVVITPAPGTTAPGEGGAITPPEPEVPVEAEPSVDYTKLKEGDFLYTGSVANMLILNFPSFSSIDTVPQEYIIAFGIMETIKNPSYVSGLSMSDLRVYITSASVELAAVSELKYNQTINHQSIAIGGEFKYDVISKKYSALSQGLDEGLVGKVAQISNNNNMIEMVVEAYNYSDIPEEGGDMPTGDNAPTPAKKAKITIDCSGSNPVIVSVTSIY